MTMFVTILAGVAVYVLGQIVQLLILTPIKDFNKERGDTSYLLLRYQQAITNVSARDPKSVEEIREMGASLIATVSQIPFYGLLSKIRAFKLPSRQEVDSAAKEINGIVYRMMKGSDASENLKALETIAAMLKIRTSY